jgi:hypothetical protein
MVGRNAAGQIWSHLPHDDGREVEQRDKPTLAQSMYPEQPSSQPRRLSYTERREAWTNHMLALSGLRRR